jgi:ribosomal protein S18 acetylase RimI-like enzyme
MGLLSRLEHLLGQYTIEPLEGVLYLGLLLVDGEIQRKGIGTEIVDAIIKASQDLFDKIQLSAGQNNSGALRFWEKQGFVVDEVSFYRETDNVPMVMMLGA